MGLALTKILPNDWRGIDRNFGKIKTHLLGPDATPTHAGLILTGLTASRLVQSDADKALASITDLTS